MKEVLQGKRILITGATGLIGRELVRKASKYGMKIIALVRNAEKAGKLFHNIPDIRYILSDTANFPVCDMGVEYIIHGAANTSSKAFTDQPVEIIRDNVGGMVNVLEFARLNPVKSLVLLSTMEVYGIQETDEKIDESHNTRLDPMNPRFCYPESKRLCENLCAAYFREYQVPAKTIRLTQTIGPGVDYRDKRVFAEFARCVVEETDIILHTRGETKRCYLSVADAVDAIFIVLCKGAPGEAYNAANEETYCSIYEMAEMAAEKCAGGRIRVIVREDDILKYGYAPTLHLNLDTSKLRNLGWAPKDDLRQIFLDLTEGMKKESTGRDPGTGPF